MEFESTKFPSGDSDKQVTVSQCPFISILTWVFHMLMVETVIANFVILIERVTSEAELTDWIFVNCRQRRSNLALNCSNPNRARQKESLANATLSEYSSLRLPEFVKRRTFKQRDTYERSSMICDERTC